MPPRPRFARGSGELDLSLDTGPEWTRVLAALSELDATAGDRVARRLREAALPVVGQVKSNALRLPALRGKHTGLRARVAEGVTVQPRLAPVAGLRIITTMREPDEAALPRGLDTRGGWRHPLYGDRRHWFRNPGYSWFREPIMDARPLFDRAAAEAIEEEVNRAARAGTRMGGLL
ncbi:hypothetical protein [Streptomyces sp. NPDC015131]|uniref:hypothetical protein n=1 Tax=Streptomyces sp. NPDC015131 TaxID=3364941 RepID=UPI0036FF0AEE